MLADMEEIPMHQAPPVMDVKAPSPETKRPLPKAPAQLPQQPGKPATPPAKSGVTAAITATVIIVLGLAALAVYAYLKQSK